MKKIKEFLHYLAGYPKLVGLLVILVVLAILSNYVIGEHYWVVLAVIAGIALVSIGFTVNRYAGVIALIFCLTIGGYRLWYWHNSLQPTIEYSELLENLGHQNIEAVKKFNPVSPQQSELIAGLQQLTDKSAVVTGRKVQAAVALQSDTSIAMDPIVERRFLEVSGQIVKVKETVNRILDSAGINISGRPKSKSVDTDTVAMDLSDNDPMVIEVPPSSILMMQVDSAYYSLDLRLNYRESTSKEIWVDADGEQISPTYKDSRRQEDYPAPELNYYSLMYREEVGGWQPFRQNGKLRIINDSSETVKVYVALNCVPNGYGCHKGVIRIKTEIRPMASYALN